VVLLGLYFISILVAWIAAPRATPDQST